MGPAVIRGGLLGTFAGFVISAGNAVVGVLLANLLIPEDMGLFRWAAALGAVGAQAASFGLEEILARELIMLKEAGREAERTALVHKILRLRILLSAAVFGALFGLVVPLLYATSTFAPRGAAGLIAAVLIGLGSMFWVNFVLVTAVLDSDFRISQARVLAIVQFAVTSSLRLLLAYLYGLGGLAVGVFAGGLVTVAVAELVLYTSMVRGKPVLPIAPGLLRRLLGDSAWRAVVVVEYAVITGIDIVLLAVLFPDAVVGQYAVAKIVVAVFAGVAAPLGTALYPHVLRRLTIDRTSPAVGESMGLTGSGAVFVLGGCFLAAPPFIILALPDYVASIPWALLMAPTVLFTFGFYYPLAAVITIERRFRLQIVVYAVALSALAAWTWIGSLILGPAAAALGQGFVFLAIHGALLAMLLSGGVLRQAGREIARSGAAVLVSGAAVFGVTTILTAGPLAVLILSLVVYPVLFVTIYGRALSGLCGRNFELASRALAELGLSARRADSLLRVFGGRPDPKVAPQRPA